MFIDFIAGINEYRMSYGEKQDKIICVRFINFMRSFHHSSEEVTK